MKYSFTRLLETLVGTKGLVLATIVETEGSTPQVPGASAIFSEAGLEAGTVGGGILEARVEAAAGKALRDGTARLMAFRLDADPADAEGAICGGAARVLVDPGISGEREAFERALGSLRKRRPGVLATRIVPGPGDIVSVERQFVEEGGVPSAADGAFPVEAGLFAGISAEDLRVAGERGRPHLVKDDVNLLFLEPVRPLPRLVVAGAGHVGRAVARLGSLLDWSVTVLDDRVEFANKGRVPEADEIVVGEIGDIMLKIEDSPDNYFVIVTRGHQKDAEALRAAIGRPAAYIGMIGSRRKVEIMRREFLEAGWATAEDWAGIHAPIGLDIGSKTVEEIAVSIAAELVLVRSGREEAGQGRP